MKENKRVEYNGKEYELVFNLNVMSEIQEEYGTLEKWGELTDGQKEPSAKAIIFGLAKMINEGIMIDNEDNGKNEPLLTNRQVGRILTEVGLQNVAQQMNKVVIESTKTEEKNA